MFPGKWTQVLSSELTTWCQVVSGVFYVSTYEGVRHMLDTNGVKDLRIKALVGGSCASLGK